MNLFKHPRIYPPATYAQRSVSIMRNFLSIVAIFLIAKMAWAESAVFDYDDFGPQALAYETIGYQWYQWNSVGDPDPIKIDDIKVVVYWNEPLGSIKGKYPINPKRKKDFRYLTFEAALKYLDSTISEHKDATNLIKTKEKLVKLKE